MSVRDVKGDTDKSRKGTAQASKRPVSVLESETLSNMSVARMRALQLVL